MTSDLSQTEPPEHVERMINIEAAPGPVWELINTPGWWVLQERIEEHEITSEGSVHTVRDDNLGEFRVETVQAREPEYVAYRWLGEVPDNLVEFFLSGDESSSMLRVVQAGYADADAGIDARREAYRDNSEGWEKALGAAKEHLED